MGSSCKAQVESTGVFAALPFSLFKAAALARGVVSISPVRGLGQ